jgi:hypothetical protein
VFQISLLRAREFLKTRGVYSKSDQYQQLGVMVKWWRVVMWQQLAFGQTLAALQHELVEFGKQALSLHVEPRVTTTEAKGTHK